MASTDGQSLIPDFRGSATSWFIATTKDLLTTGVDVPRVRSIVFFRYLQSPILLTQMVGRGTRLHEESGKLTFRIFDYTGVTALLGADFITRPPSDSDGNGTGPPRPPKVRATGLTTEVRSAGHFTVAQRDGRMLRVTWQEYEQLLIKRLLAAVPTLTKFRHAWLDAARRQDLLHALAAENLVPSHLQSHRGMNDYDLYDVLASAAYGVAPRTRAQRSAAFAESAAPPWLIQLPQPAAKVIRAIVRQFEKGGTEALDSKELFSAPEVKAAKGLAALKQAGNPHDLLRQTRETIFVA
jgi:type I restriction enzyme R subunit